MNRIKRVGMFFLGFIVMMTAFIKIDADTSITETGMNPVLKRIVVLRDKNTMEAKYYLAAHFITHLEHLDEIRKYYEEPLGKDFHYDMFVEAWHITHGIAMVAPDYRSINLLKTKLEKLRKEFKIEEINGNKIRVDGE